MNAGDGRAEMIPAVGRLASGWGVAGKHSSTRPRPRFTSGPQTPTPGDLASAAGGLAA